MTQELQKHCSDKAFYAYGTARIFERRAQDLQKYRNLITYLGIAVPLIVGAATLSFNTPISIIVVILAGLSGCAQIALSAWSLVSKWDDKHAYAITAMQGQTRLFNAWEALAKRPPTDLALRIDALDAEDQRQEQADLTQHITDKEKRFAMRSSLYHFGLSCIRCGIKPTSMTPGNCDTCGNF